MPSGLYVLGSRAGDRRNLMTLNWASQVALDPKLVAVSVEVAAVTHELVRDGGSFASSILPRSERAVVRKFVKPLTDGGEPDVLGGHPLRADTGGLPVLAAAAAWLRCDVRQVVPCGSHAVFIGEVVDCGGDPADDLEVLRMEDTRMTMAADPPPVITTGAALDEIVDRLAGADRYALDTEFHRERTYWPVLALVQVAWPATAGDPTGVALIDPLAVDVTPLGKVLAGPGTMVAHAAEQDLEVLERACGRIPTRLFDTQIAAGFAGYGTSSLSALSQQFLGVTVGKGDRLTDWRRRPLTDSQLAYAASDVDRLLDLADAVTADLEKEGRLAWAEEECLGLLARPRGGGDPLRAWWKLRDARQLRGTSRGVAQEVAAWRERRAQTLDQPIRSVLPDLAVQAIAHRPPRTEAALAQVRGLDGRHLRSEIAAEILAAVEAGLALKATDILPPPVDDVGKDQRAAMSLLMARVAQVARDERIDPAALASRTDLAAYLRGDAGARLATGWRATMVAEPVRALVEGRAVLAFEGGRLALESRSGQPYSPA